MPDGNIDDKVSKPTFNPLTPASDWKANSPFLISTSQAEGWWEGRKISMKGFCLIEHGIPKAKIKSNVIETVQRIYVLI